DEGAALIDAKPSSPRDRIKPGDGRKRTLEDSRRFPAPAVQLLPVGAGHNRSIFHDPIEQRQEAHHGLLDRHKRNCRLCRKPVSFHHTKELPGMPSTTARLRWGILGVAKI